MKNLFKKLLNSKVRRDYQFSFSKFIKKMLRMNIINSMIGIVLSSNHKISVMISWIIHARLEIVASRMLWLLGRRLRACRWMSIMKIIWSSTILILSISIRLINNKYNQWTNQSTFSKILIIIKASLSITISSLVLLFIYYLFRLWMELFMVSKLCLIIIRIKTMKYKSSTNLCNKI